VYVAVDGLVYQITFYGESLDAKGKRLLRDVDFNGSLQAARSVELPDAIAPELLYAADDPQLVEQERSVKAEAQSQEAASDLSAREYTRNSSLRKGAGGRIVRSTSRHSTARTPTNAEAPHIPAGL
jgi:hypothetical protein